MRTDGIESVAPSNAWKRMLAATPSHNASAEVRPAGKGELRVTVKRRRPWYFRRPVSWFLDPNLRQTVTLDSMGTGVWRLCDGKRTVEEVIDEFARAHRLTFHEARVAATSYMKSLVERGALAMVMK